MSLLLELPDDCFIQIFTFLTGDLRHLLSLSLVNSRFHQLQQTSAFFWKQIFEQHFPLFHVSQVELPDDVDETSTYRTYVNAYLKMLSDAKWNFSTNQAAEGLEIYDGSRNMEEYLKPEQLSSQSESNRWYSQFMKSNSGRIVVQKHSIGSSSSRKAYSDFPLKYNTGKYYFKFRIKYMNSGNNFLVGTTLKAPTPEDFAKCSSKYDEMTERRYFDYYIGYGTNQYSVYVLEGSIWNKGSSRTLVDAPAFSKYLSSKRETLIVGVFVDTDSLQIGFSVSSEPFRYDMMYSLDSTLDPQQLQDYKDGLAHFYPAVCMGEIDDCVVLDTDIIKDGEWIRKNLLL